MAEWQYNEPGKTYNQVGLQYNFLGSILGAIGEFITVFRRRRR